MLLALVVDDGNTGATEEVTMKELSQIINVFIHETYLECLIRFTVDKKAQALPVKV